MNALRRTIFAAIPLLGADILLTAAVLSAAGPDGPRSAWALLDGLASGATWQHGWGCAWAVGVMGSIVVVLLCAVGPRALPTPLRRPKPGWMLLGIWVLVGVWTIFSVYAAHRMAGTEKQPLNPWAARLWKAESGHSGFWGQGSVVAMLEIDAVSLLILMVATAMFFLARCLVRRPSIGTRGAEGTREVKRGRD